MRILLLGGTGFIGGAVVAESLARGHETVLFTRGRVTRCFGVSHRAKR